jgi:PDZ domain-containing protein
VLRETTQQMKQSQESATAAALRELRIPVTSQVIVTGVEKGYPAYGVLRKGDVITQVDGEDVRAVDDAVKLVGAHEPGEAVRLAIERDGKASQVEVRTARAKDQPARTVVGVTLRADFHYPFTVDIRLHDVGGPSAGLMFALGIVDKLTPGSLTGGEVKPIGGVAQKMVGARSAGATVFLTPAQNCAAARAAAPEGLRLVKVETLHGAIQALDALRTGMGQVPSCG